MELSHIAIWTQQLEELRAFYVRHFNGRSDSPKYTNAAKGFESYFVRFDGACSLELMRRTDITTRTEAPQLGICHFAFSCKSREEVLSQTEQLRSAGVPILSEPRTTGDGYFESSVADPDGNCIEIIFK